MKQVLLTGGSGSLGTAICESLLENPPERLVIYSRCWQKQAALKAKLGNPSWVRWFIGDVADKERLMRALDGIDTVIHAAAMKDVVSSEYNPSQAHKTNVDGTENVVNAAIDSGVKRVLVISTDKACNAVNTYGKSKSLAEGLAVASNAYARHSKTRIAVCRYGNVIGSSGSVIPLFQRQAKEGTLTVTDKRMTRYWMTMEAAVKFIFDCLNRMQGGEIFVPKIPSAKVTDIAKAIAPGCHIAEIGIRPGEKLHEELLTIQESRHAQEFDDYYVVEPEHSFYETPLIIGGMLPEGFRYSSDTNRQWLSIDEIGGLIDKLRTPGNHDCGCKSSSACVKK